MLREKGRGFIQVIGADPKLTERLCEASGRPVVWNALVLAAGPPPGAVPLGGSILGQTAALRTVSLPGDGGAAGAGVDAAATVPVLVTAEWVSPVAPEGGLVAAGRALVPGGGLVPEARFMTKQVETSS